MAKRKKKDEGLIDLQLIETFFENNRFPYFGLIVNMLIGTWFLYDAFKDEPVLNAVISF